MNRICSILDALIVAGGSLSEEDLLFIPHRLLYGETGWADGAQVLKAEEEEYVEGKKGC